MLLVQCVAIQSVDLLNVGIKYSPPNCVLLLGYSRETLANFTDFHVFALMHEFLQLHSIFFKVSFSGWSFYN